MSEKRPLISVLMSVFNGEPYLGDAMESILNQTFSDFEFVIIDDGSTDGTADVIHSFDDPRIVLIKNQENLGLARSLNRGLRAARGNLVARQDSDDVSLPRRLDIEARFLQTHEETLLVSSNIEYMGHDGRRLGQSDRACVSELVPWFLLFYNHLAGHSQVMFRRQEVVDLGGYSESTRFSQDYELWQRIARVGKIAILSEVLVRWRMHESGISTRAKREQEEFSLRNSQRSLEGLVGHDVTLPQVRRLRGFWLGTFPDGEELGEVNELLREVYKAFVRVQSVQHRAPWPFRSSIRKRIARQFVCWRYGFDRRQLGLKVRASAYATAWHPGSVMAAARRTLEGGRLA
ncbi:MAG: glycosyltransferase family 2 protein [Vicinamibacteria bacterium]